MRVAINGFGRIGRAVLKIGLDRGINFVGINDLTDTKTLAYLLKYDSVFGVYDKRVEYGDDYISIDGRRIKVFKQKDPLNLPWNDLKVDVVIESTGIFKDHGKASMHIKAGARRVVISAPSSDPDVMLVLGVNDKELKKKHKIISMASCTTNCLAPVAKVLNDKYGIKRGFMTTVHAYTNDQKILDVPHKKLRRARAAAQNIIPTSSGATSAVGVVIPQLKGKMDGLSLRVPVACGSIVDFVCELKKPVTINEVNKTLERASIGRLRGILQYTEDEIVSNDIIKNTHSSIIDGLSTQVLNDKRDKGTMVKILAWYDNEWGYSCRLVDLIKKLSKK
ncbi:type I glyceraldehyde-3-phosphate dehydrogenase [Candidatus Pacearchaeota archaeon]|nr:type I glyceraldehyde-3-phosphate dehydrogenase [Candidatus Pacearchaeota archaeon]